MVIENSAYIESIRSRIELVSTDHRILAIYLLGSVVAGRFRPDSDIDLALMPEPGIRISALERVKIGATISFDLGRDVDIGELSSENLVYSREALLNGICMFTRDHTRSELIASKLLGLYARFNEDRQELIDAYRTR